MWVLIFSELLDSQQHIKQYTFVQKLPLEQRNTIRLCLIWYAVVRTYSECYCQLTIGNWLTSVWNPITAKMLKSNFAIARCSQKL